MRIEKIICTKKLITVLAVICVNLPGTLQAQQELIIHDTISIESLEKQVESFSPKEKASVYIRCFEEFLYKNITKAKKFNEKALEICLNNNLLIEQAFCYYNNGTINRLEANHHEGIENYQRSITLFKKFNHKIGLSQCYNNIGIIYKNTNELKKAMQNYVTALDMAEEAAYQKGIAIIQSNIAVIYLRQKEYENAIVCLEKCLSFQKNKDPNVLNNLGIAHKALRNNNKALEYFKESFYIFKNKKEFQNQVNPLNNIGTIYLEEKKYEKALDCFLIVEKIEEKLNLKKDLIATYTNIGLAYRMKKEYATSISYLEKAMLLAKQQPNNPALKNVYMSLALTYEEYEKSDSAIKFLYNYIELNKEIFNLEKNKQIQELLVEFEAESKEKELVLLKKDREIKEIALENKHNELEKQKLFSELQAKRSENKILLLSKENEVQALSLQKKQIEAEKKEKEINYLTKESELQKLKFEKKQAELKQRNLLKNIAIIGAGLLIIIAVILIVLYQQKLKTVELLNIRTEEVNKQRTYELLRDQEFQAIKAGIEGQEKERKRIAQDLHDGIGGNLASIKLNLVNIIESNENDELLKVMKNIDETYNEVRSISHNLVPSKLMNQAFIQLIRNFIDEILDRKLLDVKFTTFPENELNLLPNEIKIEIYRIIQELMNNIVKYSEATNVEIQLIKREGQVNLMVEDNGIGFDTSKSGTGIGLSNIRSRIKKMNGDLNIESSVGNWTLVNIEIPLIAENV